MGKKENYCPFIKKECMGAGCNLFIKVVGTDVNTGNPVDNEGCALAFLPMLTIENSSQQRATGAAVESFRNEMVKSNELSQVLLTAAHQQIK